MLERDFVCGVLEGGSKQGIHHRIDQPEQQEFKRLTKDLSDDVRRRRSQLFGHILRRSDVYV